MIARLCLTVAVLIFSINATIAQELSVAKPDLAQVVASMTILEDYKADPLVRIVSIVDSGECDPNREAQTCPKSQLLISAAEDGEGPQRPILWQTPRRIDWEFVEWIEKPTFGPKGQIKAAFETSVCEAPEPVESGRLNPRKGGWWRSVRYRIEIKDTRATMISMSRYRDGKECALY